MWINRLTNKLRLCVHSWLFSECPLIQHVKCLIGTNLLLEFEISCKAADFQVTLLS